MGACGGKPAAKQQESRELRFHDGVHYSPLESNVHRGFLNSHLGSNDFDSPLDFETQLSVDEDTLDIVQFSAPIFVAEEGEGFSVKLMRLGSLAGTVSCYFQTEAGSGKPGVRYVHAEGEVVFGDGQFEESIDIQIIDSPDWSATLEFKVVLSNARGCSLGKYLKVCRVKVLDSDPFPNSDYAEPVKAGLDAIKEIHPLPLFVDFCRLMLQIPGNSRRFAVILLCDQLKNAYLWFQLRASVYTVNVIFGGEDAADQLIIPGDAVTTAKLLGLMYIGLPLLLHLYKEAKTRMDIAGHCNFYLQTSLMRKYMNFNDDSRAAVSLDAVQKVVIEQALDVSNSLDNVSSMLETLGRLIMLNSFAISSDPGMLWAVLTMPVVMLFWVLLRHRWLTKPEKDLPYKKRVSQLVCSISEYYSLIAAYFQRPAMNEKFAASVAKLGEVQEPLGIYHMRTEFFFAWLGPFFSGFYLCFYAQQVMDGQLSLGTFLATISVFKEVSSNFADGYSVMMSVISKFEPLNDIAVFLNRPTDVRDLKELVNRRLMETSEQRSRLMQLSVPIPPGMVRTDLLPIRLENVSFKLGMDKELFKNVDIFVEQGKLIAVEGTHGSGKTKLIRILAGGISPTSGVVTMPSHLRCVLVTHNVVLMNTSPLQNLFFGDPLALAQTEDRRRVMSILEKLGMNRTQELAEKEIEILQEPLSDEEEVDADAGYCGDVGKKKTKPTHSPWLPPDDSKRAERVRSALRGWQGTLSFQEKAKLHIARALVVNPEILILEKPLMNFDDKEYRLVQRSLREYVYNRGVALPVESRESRRPRTCFYSAEREDTSQTDVVWKCDGGSVVAEKPPLQVQEPRTSGKDMSSPNSSLTHDIQMTAV